MGVVRGFGGSCIYFGRNGVETIVSTEKPAGFKHGDVVTVIDKHKEHKDYLIKPGQNHWYAFTFPEDGKAWCMTATAVNSPTIKVALGSFSGVIGFSQGNDNCKSSKLRYEVSMSAGTDDKIAKNCTLKAGEQAWFRVTGSEHEKAIMGYRLVWDMFSY